MDNLSSTLAPKVCLVVPERGASYPTRGDFICTAEDRRDWLAVARHILTKGERDPRAIQTILSYSGTTKTELLRSFITKKPQRSLWNILFGIINSTKREKVLFPTVADIDTLLEEMDPPVPSPALSMISSVERRTEEIIMPPSRHQNRPIIPHIAQRVRGIVEKENGGKPSVPREVANVVHTQRASVTSLLELPKHNNLSVLPDVTSLGTLTGKPREDFLAFYGYRGPPYDPTDSHSYDPQLRKSYDQVAAARGTSRRAVEVSISAAYRALQKSALGKSQQSISEIHTNNTSILPIPTQKNTQGRTLLHDPSKLPNLTLVHKLSPTQQADFFAWYGYKGEGHDPTQPASYDVILCKTYQQIADARHAKTETVQVSICMARKTLGVANLPQKNGNGTRPLDAHIDSHPQHNTVTPLNHNFGVKAAPPPPRIQKATVIKPPQPIHQQFIYTPPSSPHGPETSRMGKGKLQRVFRPTRGKIRDNTDGNIFTEAIARSPEIRIFPRPPEPEVESAPKVQPKKIPHFATYRGALIWAKEQKKWLETLAKRTHRSPILKDDLSLRTWLGTHGAGDMIPFLEEMKQLQGARISFNSLMDQILAPIPEEQATLADIQRNIQWMGMIENAFREHESGNYAGFMQSIGLILSDAGLAGGIFARMPEYATGDYMDILALLAGKNWTPKDASHYSPRKLADAFKYKFGANASLDRVLEKGAHVKEKMLDKTLKNISIKVPLGLARWPRYQEYDCPEVTLYDFIVALMRADGGDISSSKAIFHTLQEVLGVQ